MNRDELIARVDVERVYDRYDVELILAGNQYRARCPFHADRNPSLSVRDDGLFHCFACDARGSIIDFVGFMEREQSSGEQSPPTAWLEPLTRKEVAGACRLLRERFLRDGADIPLRPRRPRPEGGDPPGPDQPPVPPERIDRWQVALWCPEGRKALRYIRDERGVSEAVLLSCLVGFDEASGRVTIPVYDTEGVCRNVRKYLPPPRPPGAPKVVSYARGYGANRRMNPDSHKVASEVLLLAGEMDYLLACSLGFDGADTFTNGEGSVPGPHLTEGWRRVIIWYDNDSAGRGGAARLARLLRERGIETRVVRWPAGLADGYDFSDLVREHKMTKRDVAEWIIAHTDAAADEAIAPAAEAGDAEREGVVGTAPVTPALPVPSPLAVHLSDAGSDQYVNERTLLAVDAFVLGKDRQPYLAPREVEYTCHPSKEGKFCYDCPLKGSRTVEFTAASEQLMRMVDCSDAQRAVALRDAVGIPAYCRNAGVEVKTRQTIERTLVAPPLDLLPADGTFDPRRFERTHVQRAAYVRGDGLQANQSYRFTGYTGAAPGQAVAHLFDSYELLGPDASRFVLTPDLFERLRVAFWVPPGRSGMLALRLAAIAADLAENVLHIYDRHDLTRAVDLVAHSTCRGFTLGGTRYDRSWVQALIIGDSGQGKSRVAERLHAHYRAGAFVSCENMRRTGLVGSVVQFRDGNWRCQWSAYPNNHMGWLTLDEFQALAHEAFGELTSTRQSGIATIRMVAGATTPACVRLLCVANPNGSGGRTTMSAYANGPRVILDLIPTVADIRRFDFAVAARSGEVPPEVYNNPDRRVVPHYYTSDLCHALLLWAWSREAGHIVFEPAAERRILEAATEMGRAYSAECPLVEPADQREKLARLSIACAGRTFSTPDGVQLVVTPEHVQWVVEYLQRVYTSPAMAYDAFSEQIKGTTDLDEALALDIALRLQAFRSPNPRDLDGWDTMIRVFRGADRPFAFRQLMEQLGQTDPVQAAPLMQFLSAYQLVRHTQFGYVRTPRFNAWLRRADEFHPARNPALSGRPPVIVAEGAGDA